MKNARRRFQKWLADIPFLPPAPAMPTNVTATPQSNPEQLREAAACQLTDRVRWRETMQFFKTLRHDALIEIGPRRVLSGLARLNGFGAQTTIFNIAALRGIAAMEQSARTLSPRADALANTGLT